MVRRRTRPGQAVRERHREARRVGSCKELLGRGLPARPLGARGPRDGQVGEQLARPGGDRPGAFEKRAGIGHGGGSAGAMEAVSFDGLGRATSLVRCGRVRAAPGPGHRLVVGDRRRSGIPARRLRGRGAAGRGDPLPPLRRGAETTSRPTSSGAWRSARRPSIASTRRRRARRSSAMSEVERATGAWEILVGPRDHHERLADASPQLAGALIRAARDAMRRPGRPAASGRRRGAAGAALHPGRPELRPPGRLPQLTPQPRAVRHPPGPALGGRGDRGRGAPDDQDPPLRVVRARRGRGGERRAPRPRRPPRGRLRAGRQPVGVRDDGRAPPARGRTSRPSTTRPSPMRPPRSSARSTRSTRWATRRTTSSCTPRRPASGSTRPSTGTGRSTRGCASIAGLERATALAVNPATPEYAAEVLREQLHR